MTWHLKDRELEKKLNELTKGEFSKNLHQYDDEHFASFCGEIISLTEDCGYEFDESAGKGVYRQSQFLFFFNNDAIEEVPEYNPNGWNEFPAVTPPDSRVCQLTVSHSLDEPIKYFAAFYDFRAKTWRVQDSGRQIDTKVLKDGFVTFRAWRD